MNARVSPNRFYWAEAQLPLFPSFFQVCYPHPNSSTQCCAPNVIIIDWMGHLSVHKPTILNLLCQFVPLLQYFHIIWKNKGKPLQTQLQTSFPKSLGESRIQKRNLALFINSKREKPGYEKSSWKVRTRARLPSPHPCAKLPPTCLQNSQYLPAEICHTSGISS